MDAVLHSWNSDKAALFLVRKFFAAVWVSQGGEAMQELDVPAWAVSGQWHTSVLFPSRKRSQNFDTRGWIISTSFSVSAGNQPCDLSVLSVYTYGNIFPPFRLI